jgi:DNA-binding PadR family transcriptional regulator
MVSGRVVTRCRAEGISQPFMSELIKRLQRQGLVTRIGDPEDERAALVNVTNAGRALLDDRRGHSRARLAELLTTLCRRGGGHAGPGHAGGPAHHPATHPPRRSRRQQDGHIQINQSCSYGTKRHQHGRKGLEDN